MEQRITNVHVIVCTDKELRKLRRALQNRNTVLLLLVGAAGYYLYQKLMREVNKKIDGDNLCDQIVEEIKQRTNK